MVSGWLDAWLAQRARPLDVSILCCVFLSLLSEVEMTWFAWVPTLLEYSRCFALVEYLGMMHNVTPIPFLNRTRTLPNRSVRQYPGVGTKGPSIR